MTDIITRGEIMTRQTTVRYTFTARELLELALEKLGAEATDLAIERYNEADPTDYSDGAMGIDQDAYDADANGWGLDVGLRSGVSMATARGRLGTFAVKVNRKSETEVVAASPRAEATGSRTPLDAAVVTVQVRKLD